MKRILQFAMALPVVALVIWVGRQVGPKPGKPAPPLALPQAQETGESDPGAALYQVDLIYAVLGSSRSLVAEGCDPATPDAYFERMERELKEGGYYDVGPAAFLGAKPKPPAGGQVPAVYWRSKKGTAQMVGVSDAARPGSVHSGIDVIAGVHSGACGTKWQKVHYTLPKMENGQIQFNPQALTGANEPDDLPHPAGVKRVFRLPGPSGGLVSGYTSDEDAPQIVAWYRNEMKPPWKLMEYEGVPNMPRPPDNFMYFTNADRYCLVVVGRKDKKGKTALVLSTGTL